MKKIFLILFFITLCVSQPNIFSGEKVIKWDPYDTTSQKALVEINNILRPYADDDFNVASTHRRQLLRQVHTQCTNISGICTADRVGPLGYALFISIGVAGTLAVQKIAHILNTRS